MDKQRKKAAQVSAITKGKLGLLNLLSLKIHFKLSWQEAGRRNLEMTYVRSEFENGSESDDHARSDSSNDNGYNVVIVDNCQRVFVYSLKLLWTIENRDVVWSWVGGISKAFEPDVVAVLLLR